MDLLAFLTVPAVVAATRTQQPAAAPALPTFKPRWWYRNDRLDARPVAWSLRNRPEDWEPNDSEPHWYLKHKPSGHVFRVVFGPARLYEADCDCSHRSDGGRFQRFQSPILKAAARGWLYRHRRTRTPPVSAEQFAAHFIR